MALTVETDLTVLSNANAATGWTTFSGTIVAETDYFIQGTGCLSFAYNTATRRGATFNNGSGIDFTSGTHKDKLVYIWLRTATPNLCQTRALKGMSVILGSGTTVPTASAGVWSAWHVGGSDSFIGTDGWVCYVVDPQSTASETYGGGVNKAAIQHFGATMLPTASVKGQPFGIDQVAYGRGELRVKGTVATAGEGFKEIAAVDSGNITNRWGIITEKNGVYYVKGKIVIGNATAATTFSSYNETVVWETPSYYNGSANVKSIPDASVGGTAGSDGNTTYNGLAFIGGSAATSIDMGVLVGSANGRSGSTFKCVTNSATLTTPGKTRATIAASDDSMALSLYNTSFIGFEGGVDLYGTNLTNDDCFSNTFDACGRLRSNMEIRNCNILNSVAAADDGAYIWESTTNLQNGLFVNNSRAVVFESTTGTPFSFTNNTFSGNTKDVRNESGGAITINYSGGTEPTYENIGGGSSTTVATSVTLTIEIRDSDTGNLITQNCDLTIVKVSDETILFHKEDAEIVNGTAAYAYSSGSGTNVYINVLNVGDSSKRYQNKIVYQALPASNQTTAVYLDQDRIYSNP